MPKSIPFMIRRSDTFAFRIGVPKELRTSIGCREIIRSLHTSNRRIAEPIAVELAAKAKRLFLELRQDMSTHKKNNEEDSSEDSFTTNYEFKIDFDEFKQVTSIFAKGEVHEQDSINSAIQTTLESLNQTTSTQSSRQTINNTPKSLHVNPPILFSRVINEFLESDSAKKKAPMYKKHKTVLPIFLKIIGDKQVNDLKQADINKFFKLIQLLPPLWKNIIKKKEITIETLALEKNCVTLSKKTFTSTYIACVSVFLTNSIIDWQDQGFPNHLTTKGIKYNGDRLGGESKQRHFKPNELERLFEGDEMKEFANNPQLAHKYWLPHIGLFTGARVNEICQLNPQTDILKDPESGIWYFWITERTEGDERIHKSTKNDVSRRTVPIHSKLIELGFLAYFEKIKQLGAKLIFPNWNPSRGKASGIAENWFRDFLKKIGLRDETPYEHLVGMHAFRSTLANMALNVGVNESSILGHAGEGSSVARGYQGPVWLKNQQKIIEQIIYEIDFIIPVKFIQAK
jgi:integrase